ncbi:tetratricopeptide repeat protein [Candidatus Margulisiibacteriota bacterium]
MILSPIMSYVVDKELGFPTPSEKEKINKALKRYRYLLSKHPNRSDSPEIMFGIADLLVGRNNPGDYAEAMRLYKQIMMRSIPEYLRARTLVGRAELMIGSSGEFDEAIPLCEKAKKLLGPDLSEFFAAKTYVVEVELLISRNQKGDWERALKLISSLDRQKKAHWYFKGRALLSKAEITLYRKPKDLRSALKACDAALKNLKPRLDDYFANKGKILKAEILCRREKKGDFERAEKLLTEAIKMSRTYGDLTARAKLDMAAIVSHPTARKLLRQVDQMEGLDPYLIEKARQTKQVLQDRKSAKKRRKTPRQARG